MLRVVEDRVGVAVLDDVPEVHDRDPVRDVPDDAEVVRDEEVGEVEVLLEALEQVQDLRLDRDVERRDRLVADDQLRRERQRPGDADPLPLAARELVRVAVVVLGVQADAVHELLDAPLRVALGLVDPERRADDRADRLARVERRVRVLEDHLHLAPVGAHLARGELGDVRRPRTSPCPAVESSSLMTSRAVVDLPHPDSPTSPTRLAGIDVERDLLDRVDAGDLALEDDPLGDREVLREAAHRDERVLVGLQLRALA